MTTPKADRDIPEKMPSALKWGVGLLWLQGVLAVVGGFLLLSIVNDAADHGREDTGAPGFFAVLQFLLGVLLMVGAALVPRRLPAVRIMVIVIEVLNVAGGAIGLFAGGVNFLPGIVISVVVLRALGSREGRAWFNR